MASGKIQVTAYECKTRQAEVFRRAAAGETIIVTNNGVPQVEIRKAPADEDSVAGALEALRTLQASQLAAGATGSHEELRSLQEEGRDRWR